jgi:hypothetical protein
MLATDGDRTRKLSDTLAGPRANCPRKPSSLSDNGDWLRAWTTIAAENEVLRGACPRFRTPVPVFGQALRFARPLRGGLPPSPAKKPHLIALGRQNLGKIRRKSDAPYSPRGVAAIRMGATEESKSIAREVLGPRSVATRDGNTRLLIENNQSTSGVTRVPVCTGTVRRQHG